MVDTVSDIPAHVPPRLVRDFDYFNVEPVDGDIHLGWKRWQDEGPEIFWTPHSFGHWVLTRGADIETAFNDPARFSSIVANIPREGKPFRLPLLEYDPPEHIRHRALLMPVFSPKALSQLSDYVRAMTRGLIDELQPRGECEFIADVSYKMPIGVFMHLAGLPLADADYLLPFADKTTRSPIASEQNAGFSKVVEYLEEHMRARLGKPGNDLLSLIANGEVGGRKLDYQEALALASLIMFAGLDTVVSSMGFFMRHLALHPEHRRRLIEDPARIPAAIDEILRRFGIANMGRTVAQDMEYNGVTMKQGELVLLPTALYGIDERIHQRPLEVDFDRADSRHLAFGSGAHRCIGSMLAKLELRILLEEWLPRIPEFHIKAGETPRVRSGKVNALSYLPLQWAI